MIKRFTILTFLILLNVFCISNCDAAGWGKKDNVVTYDNITWNEVYISLVGLNLKAQLPNYSHGGLYSDLVYVTGTNGENYYDIYTTYNKLADFTLTASEYLEEIQATNPEYTVIALDSKPYGVKFVFDLIPNDPSQNDYYRFYCTKNRIIQFLTNDENGNHREYFFNSFLAE